MKKILSYILILSLMLQMIPPRLAIATGNTEQVQAITEMPSPEILTIEWLSRMFQLSEISLLEQLNKGYSLQDLYTALQMKQGSDHTLNEILSLLQPSVLEQLKLIDYSAGQFEENPVTNISMVDPSVISATYGELVEISGETIFPDESLLFPSVTSSVYLENRSLMSAPLNYPTSYDQLAVTRLDIKSDSAPFSISSVNESISTINGSLSLNSTDMVLPGRNGLSFALTRSYNSNDAVYYDKSYIGDYAYYVRYYPELVGRLYYYPSYTPVTGGIGSASNFMLLPLASGSSESVYKSFVQFNGQYFYWNFNTMPIVSEFNNETRDSLAQTWKYADPDANAQDRRPIAQLSNFSLSGVPLMANAYPTGRVVEDTIRGRTYDFSYMYYANKTKEIQNENRFPIGKGWSWDIPFIETKDNGKKYIHLFGGSVYELNGLSLKGYPWKDLTLINDSSVTVNNLISSYLLKSVSGQKLSFTSDGKLIQISDSYNNTIQFEYQNVSPYGTVLSKVRDAIGNDMSITYSTTQVLITSGDRIVKYDKIKDPQGNKELLSQVTDAEGRKTQYVYEIASTPFDLVGAGRMKDNYTALVKQVYHPTNSRTDYNYETFTRSLGNSAKETVRRAKSREDVVIYTNGAESKYNRVDYSYIGDGAVVQQSNSSFSTIVNNGRTQTTYSYDRTYIDDNTPEAYYNTELRTSDGLQQSIQVMEYNRDKRWPIPIKITSKTVRGMAQSTESKTVRTYDDYGNLTSESDPNNIVTTYNYDGTTHLLSSISSPVKNGLNLYTELVRNPTYNSIKTVRLKENNASGLLKSETSYNYDAYGNPTTVTIKDDSRNIVLQSEYSLNPYNAGFPTKQSIQVTSADNLNTTVTHQFMYKKSTGEMTEYLDGKAFTTKYEYDKLGRVTRIIHPDLSTYSLQFDDTNNEVKAIDETGVTTIVKWNPLGWKISEGISGKAKAKYDYDSYGRLKWSEDGANNRTVYEYDNWNRLIGSQFPGAPSTSSTSTYDDINRSIEMTDTEGNKTKHSYDLLGRVITQESFNASNGLISSTSRTYDHVGNVQTTTDGKGNITSFSYDALGHLISVTDPELNTTKYTYSLTGALTQVEYPDLNILLKKYDQMGRLIKKTDPSGMVESYFYDANSNLVKMIDQKGQQHTYEYNNRDQLITNVSSDEMHLFSYDSAGRRLSMQDGTGTTQYSYDPATGWLNSVTYPDNRQTNYEYNAQGMRTKMTDPFGVVTAYQYNQRNQLEAVGPATNNWDITYQYKNNGLLSSLQTRNGITSNFGYNEMNLTTLSQARAGGAPLNTFSYTYDMNRNQITKTENSDLHSFTYDQLDRIATSTQSNEQYTYDDRGNRLTLQSEKTFKFNGAVYDYDNRNRLKSVSLDSGETVTYRYNGDGLLVERTETGNTTRYYYDGAHIIAEGKVTNGAVTHEASYIRGNELVARVDSSGARTYYLHNGHGDVVGLTDAAGNMLNQYTYDLWGNPLTEQETVPNPFRYSGELWDETTNLQYLRARWYDPSVGRFINEDSYQGELNNPLSLNLYTYVGNNPLNRWDPTGHSWISDQWSNLKKGIGMVTSKENWEKSGAAAAAGWNRSADLISNMNWNEAFGNATNDFKTGFSMYLVGTIGEDKYNTLNDGEWTVEDAGIIFLAYISFRANGNGGGASRSLHLETQIKGKTLKLTNKQTDDLAKYLGFKKTNEKVKGQPVYTDGKVYIVQDVDSHNGGVWKMGKSVKELGSKDTRMGTYDVLLNRMKQ